MDQDPKRDYIAQSAVGALRADGSNLMPTIYNPLEVMQLRNDAGLRFNSIGATFGPDVRRKSGGRPKPHQGWDLYAKIGTPVFAVAGGIVVWTRTQGD